MIEPAESLRVAAAVAVALAGLGICLAWLPALRYGGGPALLARVLVTAGAVAMAWDYRGLGAILGLALAAMGVAAVWQGQPEPEVPRPRRKGIVIGAVTTALLIISAARGWWLFDRLPEAAVTPAAVALAVIGALGTLSVADRSRIRLREALRDRFAVSYPYPSAAGESPS